jgi:DeoR/GlpR family transcriptional regulator of sugar metabolism
MAKIDPRKQLILDYICSKGFATPEELAQQCHVAAITARRDLIWLEQEGLLKRVHGGAVPYSAPLAITHVSVRMRTSVEAKRAMALTAAGMVTQGERLFLDSGSTCAFLAQALPNDLDLIVITNSLENIGILAHKQGIRVINPGGELDVRLNAFVGPMTETALTTFHADKAFLGVTGIDLEQGFTDNSLSEGQIKMMMARHARDVIVLADSSKFGKTAFRSVLPLTAVSQIITDPDAPEQFCDELRQRGVQVVVATA